jgi:hypothetical protein
MIPAVAGNGVATATASPSTSSLRPKRTHASPPRISATATTIRRDKGAGTPKNSTWSPGFNVPNALASKLAQP